RTELLKYEHRHYDRDHDGENGVVADAGHQHVEPFNRRGHAYRGCDKTVCNERGASDNGRIDKPLCLVSPHQRVEGEDATLAFVVSVECEINILYRSDQGKRPD